MSAPTNRRSGSEPTTARSAYGLRRVLALVALVAGAIGAVAFALAARSPGGTAGGEWAASAICVVVALTAVVDLAFIHTRREDPPHRP